ncbi:MAG: Dna2/Cas4 domain-containing protein [Candidatus Methanoperedens sp.]|nr:Dna2/Cas4 domain-containing protein [Candidatus Methanoperedens sp.]
MIRVSDITTYLKCPRMCYFMSRGHELTKDITPEYLQRLLLKELALTYGSAFNKDDKPSILSGELDRISGEIRTIYRAELAGIDDAALSNAVSGVSSCLGDICSGLSSSGDFYGQECADIEPLLHSEKFGLSGSPDKLVKIDSKLIPSIIKTGAMPENGIWQGDRLQLTAYAMLAEEKYNSVIERGFVEYARWGTVREAVIKRNERRKVLQIRDRVKKIQEGFMPERPGDAPCERCGFNGMCEVKSTLAARFF